MPDPNTEHGLRVQLTAALLDCHALRARASAAESERDALRGDVKRLREALGECSELFAAIRGDWTDPRHECRAGQEVIRAALASGGDRG